MGMLQITVIVEDSEAKIASKWPCLEAFADHRTELSDLNCLCNHASKTYKYTTDRL